MMNFPPRKLTLTETCGSRVQRSVTWVGPRSAGPITTLVTIIIIGVTVLECPPP